MDDLIQFEEESGNTGEPGPAPWKILIVDDEQDIHDATRLALRGITFKDRPLAFLDAYSGREACEIMRRESDIALVFLDVVMESEHAGLDAAQTMRREGFSLPRIVLRTGHPGYAPQQQVVMEYDIHDYKEKSELTYHKLFTCLISALRSYDDLAAIEQHRRGLLCVLESVNWFDFKSLRRYLSGMLSEFSSLAGIDVADLLIANRPSNQPAPPRIVAGAGDMEEKIGMDVGKALSAEETALVLDAFQNRTPMQSPAGATLFLSAHGQDLVAYARGERSLANSDSLLLEVFLSKVAQAIDNYQTFAVILEERNMLIRSVAMIGEKWGSHTPPELSAMQELARKTAQRLHSRLDFPGQIDDRFIFSIGPASLLHDMGQQALPQEILRKPGPLSPEERATVQKHVEAGLSLLDRYLSGLKGTPLYRMTQDIIAHHHERYDGSGYPAGLAGEALSIPARIVAVVDAFLAMTSHRPHRPALSREETLRTLAEERGRKYDPMVVEAFLEVVEDWS